MVSNAGVRKVMLVCGPDKHVKCRGNAELVGRVVSVSGEGGSELCQRVLGGMSRESVSEFRSHGRRHTVIFTT